jgi:hypothetical protein
MTSSHTQIRTCNDGILPFALGDTFPNPIIACPVDDKKIWSDGSHGWREMKISSFTMHANAI